MNRSSNKGKFKERTKEPIFLRYSEESKGSVWLTEEKNTETTRAEVLLRILKLSKWGVFKELARPEYQICTIVLGLQQLETLEASHVSIKVLTIVLISDTWSVP